MSGTTPAASIYVGTLRHRRFTPVSHTFRYPVFMVLLDIDRIPEAMQRSRVTSYNRWNWAAFMDRDHLGDPALPLRVRLERDAARAGVTLPPGRRLLLTHLRYLGYCFNPVSFFYCFDTMDRLVHVLAEVHNTFGGSHTYWLTPLERPREEAPRPFRAASKKALYVSPFVDADVSYGFAFRRPGAQLTAHIQVRRGDRGPVILDATLSLEERAWTPANLRRTLCRHPWMTASVIAAIHWEALRLWWKGVPPVPRPSPRPEYRNLSETCGKESSRL
ncbi:MAG: DUF1365 domain-containing protein [Vicinamibacterales bacterium]